MSAWDTWIGLTVAVYVFLIAFQGISYIHSSVSSVNGAENTTIKYVPIQRRINESVINSTGDWTNYATNLLNTPQNEYEQYGANYNSVSSGKTIFDIILSGNLGFSTFMHDLLGVPKGPNFVSWAIDLSQWFMCIGTVMVLLQLIGKVIPGGG